MGDGRRRHSDDSSHHNDLENQNRKKMVEAEILRLRNGVTTWKKKQLTSTKITSQFYLLDTLKMYIHAL